MSCYTAQAFALSLLERRGVWVPTVLGRPGLHVRHLHRWTSFDVDRLSRFHVEGSRQSPPLIRRRYGLRGIRVGEPSHPGPPRVRRRLRVGSSPDSTMSEDRWATNSERG